MSDTTRLDKIIALIAGLQPMDCDTETADAALVELVERTANSICTLARSADGKISGLGEIVSFDLTKTTMDYDFARDNAHNSANRNGIAKPDSQYDEIIRVIAQFDDLVLQRRMQQCKRRLREAIGIFLERFNATSAWLFFPLGKHFVSVVEQNTGKCGLLIPIENGIVGQVAKAGTPYIAPDVSAKKDPFYLKLVDSTRSEMAVPIHHPHSGDIIAVLNLEADEPYVFSPSSAWVSKELIPGLLPDILALRELLRGRALAASLSFDRIGWDIADVLGEYCTHICETMEQFGSRPSCTIWQLDAGMNELWVRATDGYDFEYIRQPLSGSPDVSFVASVANLAEGDVVSGPIEQFNVYVRREKAKRMGVSSVIAAPIYRPQSRKVFGVLNFYSFGSAHPVSVKLIQRVAAAIGRIVEEHEKVQPCIAISQFNDVICRQKSLAIDDTFDLLLQALLRFTNSDAGTIFARPEGSNELVCVATTGLASGGVRLLDPTRARYDLEKDEGFTVYLANNPGACLRKNDIPNPTKRSAIDGDNRHIEPLNKYTEVFSLSDTDHRRFLGASVRAHDSDKSAGVIRLVRAPGARPFLPTDETLLKALADASRSVFKEWKDERNLQPYVCAVKARLFGESRLTQRENAAFNRLIRPVGADFGSSLRLINELLQQVITFLSSQGCLHASVREVTTGSDGRECMRVFHFHSMRSNDSPHQPEFTTVSKREGNIGWRAIKKWKILTFVRAHCEGLFKPIHADSRLVESGIIVPLATWTGGKCVKWVLSVDFTRVIKWDERIVEFLLHVARKLTAILSDSAPPLFLPPVESLKGFVASGVLANSADWAVLKLSKCGARNSVVARYSSPTKNVHEWKRVSGEAGEFGVRASFDGHSCRIPLLFGPVEAGHLTCGSSKVNYLETAPEIDRVLSLWASLAGFSGDDESMWVGKFMPRNDPDYPHGIQIWGALPQWRPSSKLATRLKEPLQVSLEDARLLSCV